MAKARSESAELDRKIRTYLALNVALVVVGLFLFDLLGVLDVRSLLMPAMARVPGVGRAVQANVEDPRLLEREESKKERYALATWEERLAERQKVLEAKEAELRSLEEMLEARREEVRLMVREFERSRDEYRDYRKNVVQQAAYVEAMPPKEAVARLQEMDDLTVIDILREVERRAQAEGRQSIVPFLLSLMPPKRASAIQRKMMRLEREDG